jgi:hypothetical protein
MAQRFRMDFQIVKMYKDKEVNKHVKILFLSMCDMKVFLTFTFVVKILQVTRGCWWRWFTIDVPPSSLIFTIWKSIVYYRLCRDSIYFDKILVSENKLFKISKKANLLIALAIWLVYILMQFTYNYMYSVLRFSFILVMCLVPNVECLSVLSILDCPFGFLWWNNSVLCSNTTSTHLYLAIDSLCKDQ